MHIIFKVNLIDVELAVYIDDRRLYKDWIEGLTGCLPEWKLVSQQIQYCQLIGIRIAFSLAP